MDTLSSKNILISLSFKVYDVMSMIMKVHIILSLFIIIIFHKNEKRKRKKGKKERTR